MTFDPTCVEVTCVTLPKDHCVQVPWEYINVCGYSDEFCKLPHTYIHTHTYYVHTTYYVQNQWSHGLSQARQKGASFDLLFTFLVTREKTQKFLHHISHLNTYTYFANPIDFFAFPILHKIANLSCMVSLWCGSWCWFLFAPVWSNQ